MKSDKGKANGISLCKGPVVGEHGLVRELEGVKTSNPYGVWGVSNWDGPLFGREQFM